MSNVAAATFHINTVTRQIFRDINSSPSTLFFVSFNELSSTIQFLRRDFSGVRLSVTNWGSIETAETIELFFGTEAVLGLF